MNKSRIIPSLEKEIEEKNTITVFGNGERLLNLISIETLIRYVTFIIKNQYIGKLNIGEETISILDLAKRISIQKGNQHTQIIVKENGNRNKFILDISLLKKITIDA
jgi:nucleoside-diphosphate-sugar epimerase